MLIYVGLERVASGLVVFFVGRNNVVITTYTILLDFGAVLEDSSAVVWRFGIKFGGWLLLVVEKYSIMNSLGRNWVSKVAGYKNRRIE